MRQYIKRFGKIELVTAVVLLAPAIAYAGFYLSCLFDSRFTFRDMDLNNDGFVSPAEADYVSSSGAREVVLNGKHCIEYYAYKDGLTVKVLCGDREL
jgi:hypothetical protein